jgi:hypothetical protein
MKPKKPATVEDSKEREEAVKSVHTDPNYIAMRRYGNDINRLMKRYPNGAPDHIIATALLLEEDEVNRVYDMIVAKMRTIMKAE